MTQPADARSGGALPQAGPAVPEHRWLILGVIALAQLMIVLDATIMNIALPSAQQDLGFSIVDRQWVVTAYALAFGSLLLLGGKLADVFGRKVTFLAGLIGFAVASAVGGAAVNFGMLVAARAGQGAFGALLAPSALSLLAVTFSDPKERGRAFGVYGAVAGVGGAIGLLLGGVLTEYLSWRWCLYVNLIFAGIAAAGAVTLLRRQSTPGKPKLDLPGAALVSGGMFCIVYGFSNAALHGWHASSTWGFLVAGVVLLAGFAWRQTRAPEPLLPPRIVADRNRGGAYLTMLIAATGMFGVFLFLTYYLQQTLGFSPVVTGVAFLPMVACLMASSVTSNIVLMPRTGPRPLAPTGMLLASVGLVLLTRIGVHSSYATAVLPSLLIIGVGFGLVFAPVFNTGTFGVAPHDTGVASATINTGQQLGGSIGTSLLNTIFASTVASYIAGHLNPSTLVNGRPSPQLTGLALIHGYTTAFWWSAAILAFGAIVALALFRSGPLTQPGQLPPAGLAQATGTPSAAGQDGARGTVLP
ncbi:MAG TPA: DHA2 family efflux MFS transporter permease subunit [Actinomycetes bacterium]|nr:DHA2 family efflux MFS transporter permease subunit [Actinomycetes bacterium]